MNREGTNDGMVTEGDLKPVAPDIRGDEWKMPDPVFRKTSGRLPESFVTRTNANEEPKSEGVVDPEAFSAKDPSLKSPGLKLVIVAIALAAMIAFIAVFLTVLYFMFLR